MLFNSYEFIFLYLPITIAIYYIVARRKKMRWAVSWLVAASLAFYSYWNVLYLPLLLFSITFNFSIGRLIEQHFDRRKLLLTLGVGLNIALLAGFKYTGFFISSVNEIFLTSFYVPRIVLPLGISFFTFTQTAYLVDVYRGETKKYSFATYSLFVTIFPHLIAGPILNHKDMIPQFSKLENFKLNYKNMALGITVFSIGLFKKVIIADTLSPWVAVVFNNVDKLTFIESWLGALGYTLQLYFDFSGYSEMAIGIGLMMNFTLPVNFNSPYKALSIIDFWRRWHMTLSAFLKNYLYIPLGGNRQGEIKRMRNLLLTMFLGGLWHGAGWTFVVWGSMHGGFLVVNHYWRKMNLNLPRTLNWLLTFLCVVCAWVFFRANTVHEAVGILAAMVNVGNIALPSNSFPEVHMSWLTQYGIGFTKLVLPDIRRHFLEVIVLMIAVLKMKNTQARMAEVKPNWKWAFLVMGLLLYTLLSLKQKSEFLYFQF